MGNVPLPRQAVVWVIDVVAYSGWPAVITVCMALFQLAEEDLLALPYADDVLKYLVKFPRRSMLRKDNLVAEVNDIGFSLEHVENILVDCKLEDIRRLATRRHCCCSLLTPMSALSLTTPYTQWRLRMMPSAMASLHHSSPPALTHRVRALAVTESLQTRMQQPLTMQNGQARLALALEAARG